MKYAKGAKAFGFCDRCGQRYDLVDLKVQIVNGYNSGLKVCPPCMDIDHEQLRTEQIKTDDAIALRDPRPDKELVASRAFFGFNPVTGNQPKVAIGKVTVTTS